jgi:sec-independent protein translocase protein TatC
MLSDIKPHLKELQKRLGISVAAVFVLFIISFGFHDTILGWMIMPLNDALLETAKTADIIEEGKVTTTQVGGAFFVALKVSFFSGLFLAVPVILWQAWLFIAPGLYANEKKMLIPFVIGGTFMFTLGAFFAYYVVTPFGFTFLITFGSENFIP